MIENLIGSIVKVIVDRPLGSAHLYHNELIYSFNYGYVHENFAPYAQPSKRSFQTPRSVSEYSRSGQKNIEL